MGLLGGYAETDDERAAIEQRDREYMEAVQAAERIAELEAALRALLSGCTRYDENPESLVACAAYDEGVAVARKALQE